ncbi:MAG: PQQ-dependent sugar dehydrogenase [Gemmatimonadetes bacterium]|nr:PQQ-dependent sugar dehydrogenase [Gemmatimonadota bacterium]
MPFNSFRALAGLLLVSAPLLAQPTTRPLPPIDSVAGAITVNVAAFASVPDLDDIAARMMHLVDEPGTRRLFVNDMRGPIYSVSYDGKTVTRYFDTNDSTFGQLVQSRGRERGVQSFAFHPQFSQAGTPGYGKLYTWADVQDNQTTANFRPAGGSNTHHTVLLEWAAKTAAAATYDGNAPRELFRLEQPFANHNGGMLTFNPVASPGSADFGLLYVGIGDGGSGGDPQNLAQNLASVFGKILLIDPVGRNSTNGKYGVPASNPFASGRKPEALPEIYAYGVRNPQRFAWDPANGTMYLAEIGQNIVEEVSTVTAGGNLGWNVWEGSFRYVGRGGVEVANQRGDPTMIFPVVEFMHADPLFQRQVAATGIHVFRGDAITQLRNKVLFGDNPSGELFYFDADRPPNGGSTGMHRVLLRAGGEPKNLLTLIRERNAQQGKQPASRADLRFGAAADGRVFLLNKADGTIRVIVP